MRKNPADEKIVCHHIGAAGLNHPFQNLSAFLNDFIIYLYDGNKDVFNEQNRTEQNRTEQNRTHMLHCYVGKKKSQSKFYISYDPSASSMRLLNPEYKSWYMNTYVDYCLEEATKPVSEEDVEVLSLDEAIIRHKAMPPDVLSIDAESMSFDILEGAGSSLEKAIAVICEVEFDEIRLGQKTFFDIGNLLKDEFVFAGFIDEGWCYSPRRNPLGFRGLALPLMRDVLFLRKKETIHNDFSMAKLAFVSLAHGFMEYGFHAALAPRQDFWAKFINNAVYLKFIDELIQLYNTETHVYKPTFKDVNKTAGEAHNRYSRRRVQDDPDFLQKKRDMELKVLSLKRNLTEVEKIFYRYALPDVAQIIHRENQKMVYIK